MLHTIRNKWSKYFINECRGTRILRIISPFIKLNIVTELLSEFHGEKIEVITRYDLNDFRSGVSDLSALKLLIERGGRIQGIKQLHSKVYIFDNLTAIITSANLTYKGFYNNHEFGTLSKDSQLVGDCIAYFNWLRKVGGGFLDLETIREWEKQINKIPTQPLEPRLPVYGANPYYSEAGNQVFVKFLGTSSNRAPMDSSVRLEIDGSHCHYAVCFSDGNGRPRKYKDGDLIYVARIMEGGDYAIFGKGETMAHVDSRDMASEEEMKILDWKENWPVYIRVKNMVFIDTTFGNCVKLRDLLELLGAESFESTLKRSEAGEENINPRLSLIRKPAVQLSVIGANWLEESFDRCLAQFGAVDPAFIQSLHQGSPY